MKKATNIWINNFQQMLEKEKFRSDLENYFIIIIFGKVKAGKSSLGNFIAKNCTTEDKAEFFKYDEAGKKESIKQLEEINENEFATNNLECTVEIQGFKLGGMAWIDTPGLGSMVKENGELAKEYIQSADYIIYPTSSDSPLQQDEISQLKELFEQNKKVTICITKSDEVEEEECECGSEDGCEKCNQGIIEILHNKSSDRREAQEKYVKDEIKVLTTNSKLILGDVFSISTHTAKKALDTQNEDMFIESHIPMFYNLMTDVVKEKSTKLKQSVPTDGLKSFIENNILGLNSQQNSSIKEIKNSINELEHTIQDISLTFKTLQDNIESDLINEIESIVSKYEIEIDKSNAKEMFQKINDEIYKISIKIIENSVKEVFKDFDTSFNSLTKTMNFDDFTIEDQFSKITYSTKSRNKAIGATILGAIATIGIGIATGGASLAVQAGASIVGGATAGYLGGKVGEVTGSDADELIRVGDNKEEILQKFKADSVLVYKNLAKDVYMQIDKDFFAPLERVLNTLNEDLTQLENNVQNLLERI